MKKRIINTALIWGKKLGSPSKNTSKLKKIMVMAVMAVVAVVAKTKSSKTRIIIYEHFVVYIHTHYGRFVVLCYILLLYVCTCQ